MAQIPASMANSSIDADGGWAKDEELLDLLDNEKQDTMSDTTELFKKLHAQREAEADSRNEEKRVQEIKEITERIKGDQQDSGGSSRRSRSRQRTSPAREEEEEKEEDHSELHKELKIMHQKMSNEVQNGSRDWWKWIDTKHLSSELEDKNKQLWRLKTLLETLLVTYPGKYYIGQTSDLVGRHLGIKRKGPERGMKYEGGHIDSWGVMLVLAWHDGPWIAEMETILIKMKKNDPLCTNKGPGKERSNHTGICTYLYWCSIVQGIPHDVWDKEVLIKVALRDSKHHSNF